MNELEVGERYLIGLSSGVIDCQILLINSDELEVMCHLKPDQLVNSIQSITLMRNHIVWFQRVIS